MLVDANNAYPNCPDATFVRSEDTVGTLAFLDSVFLEVNSTSNLLETTTVPKGCLPEGAQCSDIADTTQTLTETDAHCILQKTEAFDHLQFATTYFADTSLFSLGNMTCGYCVSGDTLKIAECDIAPTYSAVLTQ